MIKLFNTGIKIIYTIWVLFFYCLNIFAEKPDAPSGLIIEVANNDHAVIVIDDPYPEFGWVMNDTDENEYQTAYQILVTSSAKNIKNNNGDIWDSGKTNCDESSNVQYSDNGKSLQSAHLYYWKVRIWDKDGIASPFSAPGRFIKSLNSEDWIARPIWDNSNAFNQNVCDFAYFRKKIAPLNKKIKYAIAFVTSRDARIQKSPAFKFYINKRLVGIGPFQGYNDKITYIGYEVAEFLRTDSVNILSAICESSVKEKSFLMQLHIYYENGDTTIISDNTWKSFNAQSIYNPHGTKTSNAYHYIDPFESIDSRKIPFDWMNPEFDDSNWPDARERHAYYENLMAVSKPSFEIEEITPASIKYLGNGNYDIALGSGYFGFLKLIFNNALPGDTILIRGERDIYPWTVVDWENWIIKDSTQIIEEVGYVWTDSLQIRGYAGSDTLDDSNIKFVAIRNPFNDNAADFTSSNPLLNEIYAF